LYSIESTDVPRSGYLYDRLEHGRKLSLTNAISYMLIGVGVNADLCKC